MPNPDELNEKLRWHTESKNPLRKYRREKLITYFQGQDILDIGGGMGRFAQELTNKGFKATVVDIDQQLLQYGASTYPHIKFVEGNALNLPFPDATFDEVAMEQIIEHIPQQETAIKEAYRVLKPGGKLILTTPNKYPYRLFIFTGKLLYGKFSELFSHVPGHVAELNTTQLRGLLSMFNQVDLEGINPFLKKLAKQFPIFGLGILAIAKK